LFSVRCVLELLVRAVFGGVRFAGFSLQNEHHQKPKLVFHSSTIAMMHGPINIKWEAFLRHSQEVSG